jgi:hypothetical protein
MVCGSTYYRLIPSAEMTNLLKVRMFVVHLETDDLSLVKFVFYEDKLRPVWTATVYNHFSMSSYQPLDGYDLLEDDFTSAV